VAPLWRAIMLPGRVKSRIGGRRTEGLWKRIRGVFAWQGQKLNYSFWRERNRGPLRGGEYGNPRTKREGSEARRRGKTSFFVTTKQKEKCDKAGGP